MNESPRGIAYRRAWVVPRGDRDRPRMVNYAVAVHGQLDHVVKGEARMKPLKETAWDTFRDWYYSEKRALSDLQNAFEKAFADVPEPVQVPFVLSDEAITVRRKLSLGIAGDADDCAVLSRELDRAVRTLASAPAPEEYSEEQVQAALRAWFADPDSIDKNGDMRAALAAAGVRALAASAAEPLSEELRDDAERLCASSAYLDGSRIKRVASELLRRCPKPEPARKTAREISDELVRRVNSNLTYHVELDELVRRAEENEKP